MTLNKKIILPIAILVIGISLYFAFTAMKKPPEVKPEVDNTPIVSVEEVVVSPLTLNIESYGIVKPKYETEMVAQINGEIVELSPLFVRGGFVNKGQLLARVDPSDYQAALIDAEAKMASAKASLETEEAQGKVAKNEWKSITNSAPSQLSLRKPQLAQELANVKSAQASVLRAKRNLERTEIRAPYDAMIESRNVGLGSYVGTGNKVGKLLGTAVAEIRLPVADNKLALLKADVVNSDVMLEGTYSGQKKIWNAKIVRSEGVIDSASRMSYLVAEINDPYALIQNNKTPVRFGSYVNAKILGLDIPEATRIPSHLVENNRVAILDSESKLHYLELKIIRQDGQNIIASEGLKNGDQLIISALDYPIEGMKLALIGDKSELDSSLNNDNNVDKVTNAIQVASNDSSSKE